MDKKEKALQIWVQLKKSSQPIYHKNVVNTYQKGAFYCVFADEIVYKYPVANIWRVIEDYGYHGRPK